MPERSKPGVSRVDRLNDEGLSRLEAHLKRGMNINKAVLTQWVRRYGDDAIEILRKYDKYSADIKD